MGEAGPWLAPWLVGTVALPLVAAPLVFLFGPRHATAVSVAVGLGVTLCLAVLGGAVLEHGPLRYALGGWEAPLGIEWRVDVLALAFLGTTALVCLGVTVFAEGHLRVVDPHSRLPGFWPLFLFLWGALNALFLSADLFNLYVTLELVSLAAVALVTLEGKAVALAAGMRYLLFALFGSLSYLLGVALLYGAFGSLDLGLLGARVAPGAPAVLALALMSAGLFAKTALFPLHVWLPAAHGAAPAPASAMLSALVVKGSFYILLRLWFEVFPGVTTAGAAQLLGALGAAAVIWGSLLALRQARLKLLVAYSTVAQLGYLLLIFPLAGAAGAWTAVAWSGGVYLALSHGFAKAAMFLGTGLILQSLGHDRLDRLRGAAQHLPMTVFALAIAGLTLMGLPPSGGFIAKWLLLEAALGSGQWWWAVVLLGGGLLAALYMFAILGPAFGIRGEAGVFQAVPRHLELAALALAAVSLLLGVLSAVPIALLEADAPGIAGEGAP